MAFDGAEKPILRLADRHQTSSVLIDVFGPSDPRGGTMAWTCCGLDSDVVDNEAPILPGSDSIREGLRMKTCRKLVFTDSTLFHAVLRATGRADTNYFTSSAQPVQPNAAEIVGAYKLFWPGMVPSPAVTLYFGL